MFKISSLLFQMTIADVLRHEGGMPVFSQQMNIEDCFPENIKNNNIGKIIEDEELNFPEGDFRHVKTTSLKLHKREPFIILSRREYHGLSRGMILREVFRRAESDNRTLGHFLEENVFRKLGVGVHMGLRPEDQERLKIVNVESLSAEQVETCTRSCIKYHQHVNRFKRLLRLLAGKMF